jgi:hypothetical protein
LTVIVYRRYRAHYISRMMQQPAVNQPAAESLDFPRTPNGELAGLSAPPLRTEALNLALDATLIGLAVQGLRRMFAWMYEAPKRTR